MPYIRAIISHDIHNSPESVYLRAVLLSQGLGAPRDTVTAYDLLQTATESVLLIVQLPDHLCEFVYADLFRLFLCLCSLGPRGSHGGSCSHVVFRCRPIAKNRTRAAELFKRAIDAVRLCRHRSARLKLCCCVAAVSFALLVISFEDCISHVRVYGSFRVCRARRMRSLIWR